LISTLSVLPIIAGITIAGVTNPLNLPERYYGFLLSMTLVFYSLCEEYGWRGYLQQALKPLKLPLRVFLIGTLWYIWHLNFLNPSITVQAHMIQYGSLLLGAWGLLKISEVTNSLLFVASVHLIFNVLADVPLLWNAKIIIVISAIIVWIALIFYLVRKEKDLLNQGK
jgi:membrane protease YdiL (CAAX protease family)